MKYHRVDDLLANANDKTLPPIIRLQAAIGLEIGIVPGIATANTVWNDGDIELGDDLKCYLHTRSSGGALRRVKINSQESAK